jgi:hypothetical protein
MQNIAHTALDDQLPVKALILLLREVVACGSEPAHLNVRKYTMASEGMSRSQILCQPVRCNGKQHTPVKFCVSLCNVMENSIPQSTWPGTASALA